MKEGIHPKYVDATVSCTCGYTFKTRSTKPVIRLDICSHCHPFFTGMQKLVDSAGRVERFQKKYKTVIPAERKKIKGVRLKKRPVKKILKMVLKKKKPERR